MNGEQPVRVLAARRADAGTVRLGERDITGLVLCAEHYGAPYDLLAAALDVRPDRPSPKIMLAIWPVTLGRPPGPARVRCSP